MITQESTHAEKAKAARREANLRRRVYPRWIESGRLAQAKADSEIKVMEEIAVYFEARANEDEQAARPTLL